MKNSLVIFIIAFLLHNCGNQIGDNYLLNVSKKYLDFDLLLIIPADSDGKTLDVCISNTELYKDVFSAKKDSGYEDFLEFIQSIYNAKKTLECKELKGLPHKVINPEANVFQYYENNGLNSLIGSYLNKEGNNFSSVYSIDEDDKYGLIKIMFENNYYISWNDYRACFIFTKEIENKDKL